MDPGAVRRLADGRPYTGRQALKLGLIDQIGGQPEARQWLAREKRISPRFALANRRPTGLRRQGAWREFADRSRKRFGKPPSPNGLGLTGARALASLSAIVGDQSIGRMRDDQIGADRRAGRSESPSARRRHRADRRHHLRADRRRPGTRRARRTARLRRLHGQATVARGPGAIRAPAPPFRCSRNRCPSSRPERSCANGSIGRRPRPRRRANASRSERPCACCSPCPS